MATKEKIAQLKEKVEKLKNLITREERFTAMNEIIDGIYAIIHSSNLKKVVFSDIEDIRSILEGVMEGLSKVRLIKEEEMETNKKFKKLQKNFKRKGEEKAKNYRTIMGESPQKE